ncbi:MAG: hypothetical protein AAFV53_26345 [Myxococcota bacterium]
MTRTTLSPRLSARLSGLRQHWPLLILLLVVTVAYARLWSVGWSWDDEALVVDNQQTGSLSNIVELFTRDLWSTTRLETLKSGYYRPLMLLSLAIDRALVPEIRTQAASTLAHVHSLLWHLLAVSGLYAVLVRMLPVAGAALGATLFALHPVNAEVLALVAARNDSMAAAFTLLAIWLVMDRGWNLWRALGAGALFLAGLLSKESAVLGPLMLLTLDLARFRTIGDWRRYLPFVFSGAVYLAMRVMADINAGIMPGESSFQILSDNLLGITALYGKLLVWPWPLTPARHVHYLPALGESLFGLVIFIGLVAYGIARGEHRNLVILGLIWAGLAFAPSLAATLDKGLLGERYLYFGVAGLGLSLAAAIPRPPMWAAPAMALPAVIALQVRLPQWQNSRTVWEAAHEVAPSPFTAAGLAWYYHRDKELDKALPLLVMALEGEPPYRDACELITMAFLEDKQPQKAAEIAEWAVNERGCPPRGLIIDHWAVGLAGTGQWQEAAQVALRQQGGPQGPGLIVIASAYAVQGRVDKALMVAQQSGDPEFTRRTLKMLRLGGAGAAADNLLVGVGVNEARLGRLDKVRAISTDPAYLARVAQVLRSNGDVEVAERLAPSPQ